MWLSSVDDELRRIAARKLLHEKVGEALDATELVHEAYLRLFGSNRKNGRQYQHWDSRGQFFAAAAEAMRRILIENARRKKRIKHGGNQQRVELSDQNLAIHDEPDDLLALDAALMKFALEDPMAAELVKLHVFIGLSIEHVAEVLGVSRATAYRNWSYARTWLRCEVEDNAQRHPSNKVRRIIETNRRRQRMESWSNDLFRKSSTSA